MRKIFVLVLLGAATMGCSIKGVGPGEVGIKWDWFGGTKKVTYGEGNHTYAIWNRMYIYDLKTMDTKEILHCLTNNGLSIELETSVRYRPIADKILTLHTSIGPDYYNVVVGPTVRSEARKIIGRYLPEEIYSTRRETIEKEIVEESKKLLEEKHVVLETILIRDVKLPDKIVAAIADKLEEEQKALKMHFTLLKEKQEAERKTIEAKGIKSFQEIVQQGITPNLLKWKGIEATEKLASSPNAKIIVVGNGDKGLPVIMGQW